MVLGIDPTDKKKVRLLLEDDVFTCALTSEVRHL